MRLAQVYPDHLDVSWKVPIMYPTLLSLSIS